MRIVHACCRDALRVLLRLIILQEPSLNVENSLTKQFNCVMASFLQHVCFIFAGSYIDYNATALLSLHLALLSTYHINGLKVKIVSLSFLYFLIYANDSLHEKNNSQTQLHFVILSYPAFQPLPTKQSLFKQLSSI